MAKRCVENTKRGSRCKAAPLKNSDMCLFHTRKVSKLAVRYSRKNRRK